MNSKWFKDLGVKCEALLEEISFKMLLKQELSNRTPVAQERAPNING